MTGKKGRSGGAHNCKRAADKRSVLLRYRCTASIRDELDLLVTATFPVEKRSGKTNRIIDEAIHELYQKRVVNRYPSNVLPGRYVDFCDHFLEVYHPELRDDTLSHDYYISSEFGNTAIRAIRYLDKPVISSVVQKISRMFSAEVSGIHIYFLRTYHLHFEPTEIVHHMIRYLHEKNVEKRE